MPSSNATAALHWKWAVFDSPQVALSRIRPGNAPALPRESTSVQTEERMILAAVCLQDGTGHES